MNPEKSDFNQENDAYEINLNERKRWLFFGLPFTFTKYRLTNKKLEASKGLFTTVEETVLLYRVMDITFSRTFWQKLFKLGTIIVLSSDKTNPELKIENIKNAKAFKEVLSGQVESERLRMRFRTGEYIGADFSEDMDVDNIQ